MTKTSQITLYPPHACRIRLLMWASILTCGFIFYLSGRIFFAAIATYQAESFLEDWVHKGHIPTAKAWFIAAEAAQRAIDLYPVEDGDYYDRLGRIYEWKEIDQPLGNSNVEYSRLQALDAYRQSVGVRPLWPYTWVQILSVKMRLLQFDKEFNQALWNAFTLGPWRIQSNAYLAYYGLQSWPKLSKVQRDLVLETIHRTVADSNSRAEQIMKHAKRLKLTEKVCSAIPDELQQRRLICL